MVTLPNGEASSLIRLERGYHSQHWQRNPLVNSRCNTKSSLHFSYPIEEGKDTFHTLFLYSSEPITKWIFPCQSLSSAYTMLILSSDIILFDFELE